MCPLAPNQRQKVAEIMVWLHLADGLRLEEAYRQKSEIRIVKIQLSQVRLPTSHR